MADQEKPNQAEKPKKKVNKEVARVKMLSYMTATRKRYHTYYTSWNYPSLNRFFVADEYDKVLTSVERHGRETQLDRLPLPLECLVDTLSFLPHPNMDVQGKNGSQSRNPGIQKMLRTCTMMLFVIMENSHMKSPKTAPAIAPPDFAPFSETDEICKTESKAREPRMKLKKKPLRRTSSSDYDSDSEGGIGEVAGAVLQMLAGDSD